MLFEASYTKEKRYAFNPLYVTDILEDENNSCLIYLVNNDSPIHVNMTFDQVMKICNS